MIPNFIVYPFVLYVALCSVFSTITKLNRHVAYMATVLLMFIPKFIECVFLRFGSPDMRMESELIISYVSISIVYIIHTHEINERGIEIAFIFAGLIILHEIFNHFLDNTLHRIFFLLSMVTSCQFLSSLVAVKYENTARFLWALFTGLQWVSVCGTLLTDIFHEQHVWIHFVVIMLVPYIFPSDTYTRVDSGILIGGPSKLLLVWEKNPIPSSKFLTTEGSPPVNLLDFDILQTGPIHDVMPTTTTTLKEEENLLFID